MFFEDSRPDRKKRALKASGRARITDLERSPIPPAKSYELLTPMELFGSGDRAFTYDVESYSNYFLVSFKCIDSKKVIYFEDSPEGYAINGCQVTQEQWTGQLLYILHRFLIIGFNSRTYDLPIVLVAIQGVRAFKLHEITLEIIEQSLQAYEVERKYCLKVPTVNHIDLIEVAPIEASLKIYAGRLHCERMQDLPFGPHTVLEKWQAEVVRDYNINDLDSTELLYNFLKPQIELREALGREFQQDLRSKSDAQIAESVLGHELAKLGVSGKKPNIEPGWQFYYKVPSFIEFRTPQFQHVLKVVAETPFTVGNGGSADCPPEIKALKPKLGLGTYRLGVGGLHSSEESVAYQATADMLLIDRDVASFYPYIILNLGLFPEHLGPEFLKVYRGLVDRRLDAKRRAKVAKEKGRHGIGGNGGPSLEPKLTEAEHWAIIADALKITINGTFGKLGNLWSKIYAPDLLTQVTMTGQLSLLMFIEMVELAGFVVVSANTDGIVIRCPADRYAELETVVMMWEEKTGFITEETRYKGLYSRDVNNYIAVKYKSETDDAGNIIWLNETDGCKTKGVFSEVGSAQNSPLSKNPESYICSMAVQAFLEHGTPIAETIYNCGANVKAKYYPTPISRFVSVRTVKGGAEKNGVFLGKAIRWYYARGETGAINYVLSGNQVPRSQGAKPYMIMTNGLPEDIDFDRYISDAEEILFDVGYYRRAQTGRLL